MANKSSWLITIFDWCIREDPLNIQINISFSRLEESHILSRFAGNRKNLALVLKFRHLSIWNSSERFLHRRLHILNRFTWQYNQLHCSRIVVIIKKFSEIIQCLLKLGQIRCFCLGIRSLEEYRLTITEQKPFTNLRCLC